MHQDPSGRRQTHQSPPGGPYDGAAAPVGYGGPRGISCTLGLFGRRCCGTPGTLVGGRGGGLGGALATPPGLGDREYSAGGGFLQG
jgi:hypothetical protein